MAIEADELRAVAKAIAAQHRSDPDGWEEMAANIIAGVDALFAIRQIKLATAIETVRSQKPQPVIIETASPAIEPPVDGPMAANVERIRPNPNRKRGGKAAAEPEAVPAE